MMSEQEPGSVQVDKTRSEKEISSIPVDASQSEKEAGPIQLDSSRSELEARPKRRWLLWGGIGAAVVVLLAAAFVAGRLLAGGRLNDPAGMISVRMEPPADVPQEPPAVMGQVDKIEGKVLTLQASVSGARQQVMISAGSSGQGSGPAVNSGPEPAAGETKVVEVVVTNQTRLLKAIAPSPDEVRKGGTFQMTSEEITLEQIQAGSMVQVWGEKTGDRVVADVIMMQEAMVGP